MESPFLFGAFLGVVMTLSGGIIAHWCLNREQDLSVFEGTFGELEHPLLDGDDASDFHLEIDSEGRAIV